MTRPAQEVQHGYWPGSDRSICGEEIREGPVMREAKVHDVPWTPHLVDVCPECLHGVLIGPLTRGGDRLRPVVTGYVLCEREVR